MRTEDANKKFRRWPPRVKRRRSRNTPSHPSPEVAHTGVPEAESVPANKAVRISYRSRRIPSRGNGDV